MTDDSTQDGGGGAGEVVVALRQAAELLRAIGREHPRGPGRWADPDGAHRRRAGRKRVAAQCRPGARPGHGTRSGAWQADPAADPLKTFEHLILVGSPLVECPPQHSTCTRP